MSDEPAEDRSVRGNKINPYSIGEGNPVESIDTKKLAVGGQESNLNWELYDSYETDNPEKLNQSLSTITDQTDADENEVDHLVMLWISSSEGGADPNIQIEVGSESTSDYSYVKADGTTKNNEQQWELASVNADYGSFKGRYEISTPRSRPIIHGSGVARYLDSPLSAGAINSFSGENKDTIVVKSTENISEAAIYLYGRRWGR